MDAIFIDSKGNKKNFLYQYDKGQTFIVEDFEYSKAPKVQFSIKSIKTTPSVNSKIVNGDLQVSIPDMLLTYGEPMVAYLYIEDNLIGNTVETIFISVIPRKRPADYIYTEEMFARVINGTLMADNLGTVDVGTWSDNNTSNEDRSGYFATLNYNNINNDLIVSKSTSLDDVYGVVVDEAGFATNCNEDKLDSNGNLLHKYAYVCTSGFAKVIQDGTCNVGDNCKPNANGIATKADNTLGYKVVHKIDSKHVLIFVDQSMQTIKNIVDNSNDIGDELTAHKNDKSNPHSVTKSQVGLSNVPNVTTNNQTPTYTEATTLSKLTSGETLSAAFGKISKAVTDLISHIANKSNPHGVTKSQVGLGNVDNTSDVNKPVSTAQATAISDAKTEVQNNLNTHASNVSNPHKVTAAQVGAYTKAETDTKIANLIDSAPETLNTLNELAASLGDDPNFATTMSTELGKKATKDELNTHANNTSNPHNVTKSQVGLGNVNNTSDANKPISTATQTALNAKADLVNGIVPTSQLPTSFSPTAHASTHKTGGSDAIKPSDIGAASQSDFTELKNKVDSLTFGDGIVITDSVTGKQYTLGMQDGKLVVVLIENN